MVEPYKLKLACSWLRKASTHWQSAKTTFLKGKTINNNTNIKILVVCHKPYWVPQDSMYEPVQVGAKGKETIPGFQRDDDGINISEKNPNYCELTALYWAWKNQEKLGNPEYIGLVHYRRYFKGCGENNIATKNEICAALENAPVIVPKKRNYYISTVEEHYASTFDGNHIEALRTALLEQDASVLPAFNKHMKEKTIHICNMCVMRCDLLNSYCNWLFPILERAEQEIDFTNMTDFEVRCMGRISELLLDTWLDTRNVAFTELPVTSIERTNWLKKGSAFLGAKYLNRKYKASF